MKKLIIYLFAIMLSFASYAQSQYNATNYPKLIKEDTTYFKYKGIRYSKVESCYENGSHSGRIRNIDAKYKGKRVLVGRNYSPDKVMREYYSRIDAQVKKEVMEIYLNFIKENFSSEEKSKLLNSIKNLKKGVFACDMFVGVSGSFMHIEWRYCSDTYKDEDIANLDMLVRKNLILKGSGLPSQRARGTGTPIDRKATIEFLEKELNQEK